MSTLYAAFTRGNYSLALTTGRYRLADTFTPPAFAAQPLFAPGTAANRRGASLVSTRPVNREFAFDLHIEGNSHAEIARAAADVQAFLDAAGDDALPVYFEVRPVGEVPPPLWGAFGANYRYEVVFGSVTLPEAYGSAYLRDTALPGCRVALTLRPFALGSQQRLASAVGRLHEDTLGALDGASRGLHVGSSLTNKMTNPVFGSVTYSTGWTADASLTASENRDPRYLMNPFMSSAKLISRAANQEFYQSINVGNTNTHTFVAVVARPDLSTPSSSDVVLFYSSTLTTTFTELGNGLWLLTATAAGINASTNTGVQVLNGRAIYLMYYGCFETSAGWVYPLWGDLLGCAFSGTAHASTSTVTAGRVRLPIYDDTFNVAQWTIRMVVRWKVPNTHSANMQFFSLGSTNIRALFNAADDTFRLSDNTSTITTSAQTFAAEEEMVLHFVAIPGTGMIVYVNGVSVGTAATYTPPALGTYIYIGTDDTATTHLQAVIMDFAVFDVGLTAAQVLSDYNNIAQVMADGQRLGGVPWLWTKDGDDVVDNANDSGRNNFALVGGIPGSAPAEYLLHVNSSADDVAGDPYYLNAFAAPVNIKVDEVLFLDLSGTVSAGQAGGEVTTVSVTTADSDTLGSRPASTPLWVSRLLANLEEFGRRTVLVRLADAGSGLRIAGRHSYSGATLTTEWKSISTSATQQVYATPEMVMVSGSPSKLASTTGRVIFRRSAGTANVTADYFQLALGNLLYFTPSGGSSGGSKVLLDERRQIVTACDSAATLPISQTDRYNVAGVFPALRPHLYNHLAWVRFGGITSTLTVTRFLVWARYALL